jgi:transcriptional regulator with XRE-family HTH domain
MGRAEESLGGLPQLVGTNVRRLRTPKGLSQEAFADLCGYHRTYVSDIERGRRNISLTTLQDMGEALGVAPASLA